MLDRDRYADAYPYTGEYENRKFRGLKIIESTLGILSEGGPNLDPLARKELRTHIDLEFEALGLKPGDYAGLRNLREWLFEYNSKDTPGSHDYPSTEEFRNNYFRILIASKAPVYPNIMFPAKGPELPDVPPEPLATDVGQHAQYDWRSLHGRGGLSSLDYLYRLGKTMSNALRYTTRYEYGYRDIIKVGPQWSIENGPHRAFALRILGLEYIEKSGMNRWVVVRRDEPMA